MKKNTVRILLTVLIVSGFFGTCLLLEFLGKKNRSRHVSFEKDKTVFIARTTTDLYGFWKNKAVKGAIFVHAGKYLHYEAPDPPVDFRPGKEYPMVITPLREKHENNLSYRNYLWNGVHSGMSRKLYYVLSPESFNERFPEGVSESIMVREGGFVTHDLGTKRVIGTSFPNSSEQFVLNVDASFLAGSTGFSLVREMLASTAKLKLVTICLAEDNPDISAAERTKTMEIVNSLMASSGIKVVKIPPALKAVQ